MEKLSFYIGKDNHGIYFGQNVEFSFLETVVQDNWLLNSISLVTTDSYKAHKKKPSLGFHTIYAIMHNTPNNNLLTPANPHLGQMMYENILNNNQGKSFNIMQINVLWQDQKKSFLAIEYESGLNGEYHFM